MSSRNGPQACSRHYWIIIGVGISGTRAGMCPKCLCVPLTLFGVSASLRCCICPSRWLASYRSAQTSHPCWLVPDDMSYSAESFSLFMPVAVARLTLNLFS